MTSTQFLARVKRAVICLIALTLLDVKIAASSPQQKPGAKYDASSSSGSDTNSAQPARKILKFPADSSCGKVFLCPKTWDPLGDVPNQFTTEGGAYKSIGEARGDLSIPFDATIRFRPAAVLLHNPALLQPLTAKSIQFLDLFGADVDQQTIKLIGIFPNLRRLDLSMADLSDEQLKMIYWPPHLESLLLNATPIRGMYIDHLASLKILHSLSLVSDFLNPESYRQLAMLGSLTKLDLSKTGIQDSDLEYLLPRLTNLKSLALVSCRKLTPKASQFFTDLPKLEFVDISGTKLRAKDLTHPASKTHPALYVYQENKKPSFTPAEAEKYFHPLK